MADPDRTVDRTNTYAPASDPAGTIDQSFASSPTDAGPVGGGAAGPASGDQFALGAEIARGGMGEVYAARDRRLGRDVAVKVLQAKLAGTAAERRFYEEARVTARLQHPGIPPVYDLGALPDGRPFLAMKLIQGLTLGDLLKRDGPGGRWLGAFEGVCQAVAYAHAQGVVHRDLKPANVMVGTFGEVQVMDWGLAKVLNPVRREAESSEPIAGDFWESVEAEGQGAEARTRAGAVMGTPAYMPPEQARGETAAVDRRSDVFGLGAVFCALLTGEPPFVGADGRSTLAAAAAGDLSGAVARLDGCGGDPELVALCKRCLSATAAERPADAGAVAAAVAGLRRAADERAQKAAEERVAAEARAAGERKRRTAGRRWAVAVVGVFAVGAGLTGWQAWRATTANWAKDGELAGRTAAEADARTEAANAQAAEAKAVEREGAERAARETAEAVQAFTRAVFSQASAYGQASNTREAKLRLTVEEAMDHAGGEVDKVFAGRPGVEASVRFTIGDTYHGLGAYAKAVPHLERALALCRQVHGDAHPYTRTAANSLALLYQVRGDAAAEPLFREVLAGHRAALGVAHPDTLTSLSNLALLHSDRGEFEAAEPLYREALAGRRKALGDDHTDTLSSVYGLAVLYQRRRDLQTAEPLHAEALAGRRKALGGTHPATLLSLNSMAALHRDRGDLAAAEPLFREALAGSRKALGDAHHHTLAVVNNLAMVYLGRRDHRAAEPLLRESLAGHRQTLGDTHQHTLTILNNLAGLYLERNDLAAAEPLFREAWAGCQKALGDAHPLTLTSLTNLGIVLFERDQYAEVIPLLRAADRGYQQRPERAATALLVRSRLGLALLSNGQPAEAEPHLRATHAGLAGQKSLSAANRNRLRRVTQALADLCAAGRPAEAAEWRAKLAALPPEVAPPPRPAR